MGFLKVDESGNSSGMAASRIPAILRIGVTGHRKLNYPEMVEAKVRDVLAGLDELLSAEVRYSPRLFMAISPLAEGSDRIVAREILAWKGKGTDCLPFLEAVLPLPPGEYEKDFRTDASLKEFRDLLGQARLTRLMSKTGSRESSYEYAGNYVVNSCDLLIAVWNGKEAAGQGGTAEIVRYARSLSHPLIWINSESGEVRYEWDKKKVLGSLKIIDGFNREWLSPGKIADFSARRYEGIASKGRSAGIPEDVLDSGRALMPGYARASLLAKRYRRIFLSASISMYLLAVFVVACVIFPHFFIDGFYEWLTGIMPWFPFSLQQLLLLIKGAEIASMLAILAIILTAEKFQKRWTDYRFLTERIRTALILTVAGTSPGPLRYDERLYKPRQPDYWIAKAYMGLWYLTPRVLQPIDLDKQKKFLRTAWIQDQIAFYREHGERHKATYDILDLITKLLFIITLIAALVSFADLMAVSPVIENPTLLSIGILFPVAGASLAGLIAIRGYLRNAERYHQMREPLGNMEKRIDNAPDLNGLIDAVDETYELILRENNEWRFNLLSLKLR
ncbi:MAG TPA: hypothetical protein VGJ92_08500 [Methanocella sp.]